MRSAACTTKTPVSSDRPSYVLWWIQGFSKTEILATTGSHVTSKYKALKIFPEKKIEYLNKKFNPSPT